MKIKTRAFKPSICDCCGQTTDYVLPMSKGLAIMLLKIYNHIHTKKVNCVHLRKEMEGKTLTSNEVGNASHLIFHGLLKDHEEAGNVMLTQKAIQFIKQDLVIPKNIILKKGSDRPIGYWEEHNVVWLKKLLKEDVYWEGEYIRVGNVLK